MIRIRLKSTMNQYLKEVGPWLDKEMPNPPLPNEQRWSLADEEDDAYIDFTNDHDATLFALKWS